MSEQHQDQQQQQQQQAVGTGPQPVAPPRQRKDPGSQLQVEPESRREQQQQMTRVVPSWKGLHMPTRSSPLKRMVSSPGNTLRSPLKQTQVTATAPCNAQAW